MKLTAKKYAQALVHVLSEAKEDPKAIARNVIDVLVRRRQIKLLRAILSHLEVEWCRAQGITRVEIEYAPKFKDSLSVLQEMLQSKGKMLIHAKPRENLIGGYRLTIEDTMIDASLSTRLRTLATRMKK